jgi:hypothetical protein
MHHALVEFEKCDEGAKRARENPFGGSNEQARAPAVSYMCGSRGGFRSRATKYGPVGLAHRYCSEPTWGLEPQTCALRKHCSTTELSGQDGGEHTRRRTRVKPPRASANLVRRFASRPTGSWP